jgi:outer membrane protein TolC
MQRNEDDASQAHVELPSDDEISVTLSDAPESSRDEASEPIDLVTALRLASEKNLNVEIFEARLRASRADVDSATALFLPDLSLSMDYGRHDGRLQETRGSVFDVSKSSLFLGPQFRMHFDFAEAAFERLRAKQELEATRHGKERTVAESVVHAAMLYLSLLESHALIDVALDGVRFSEALVSLSERMVQAKGELDVNLARARARLAADQQRLVEARHRSRAASVKLAVWLRLPPRTNFVPSEAVLHPVTLVETDEDLDSILAEAMRRRPDVKELEFLQRAAAETMSGARWSPWIPEADVFARYGYFGGGSGSSFGEFDDSLDVGAGLSWSFRGFGFGDAARYRRARAEHDVASKRQQQLHDSIVGQIITTWERVESLRAGLETARSRVEASSQALELVQARFDAQDALQIEVFEAMQEVEQARAEMIAAIIDYNKTQHLLHYQVFGAAWIVE